MNLTIEFIPLIVRYITKRSCAILAFIGIFFNITGCYSKPCKSCPEYIQAFLQYKTHYPFIHYRQNYWQWKDVQAVQPFFEALKHTDSQKVKIVHIGDSHVQADVFTGFIRGRLQDIFGNGGRGLVFPYAAARTHSAVDYLTYVTGKWEYAKNIHYEPKFSLGLTGVTIRTQDQRATFRFNFHSNTAKTAKTLLKIYHPQNKTGSFILNLKTSPTELPIKINLDTADTALPYTKLLFDKPIDWLEGSFSGSNGGYFFETYGFSLENPEETGILYHSVGINGAGLYSILAQDLMANQIAEINPNLVVIDLGANDYYGSNINEIEYEQNLRKIIQNIREACPNTSFLIGCSQDIYRYHYNITDCEKASQIAQKVAFDLNCAFYDYYNVAGGKNVMLEWENYQLAKRDRVHLTNEGYLNRGELFANALLTSYYAYLKNENPVNLQINESIMDDSTDNITRPEMNTDSLGVTVFFAKQNITKPVSTYKNPYMNTATYVARTTRSSTHTVQHGENLGAIAQKYHVSVKNIMLWNNLRNTTIFPKQKLIIQLPPTNQFQPRTPTTQTKPPATSQTTTPNSTQKSLKPTQYTVKNGDNLWIIAKKHGTTVEKIQKLNPKIGSTLRVGQIILIP